MGLRFSNHPSCIVEAMIERSAPSYEVACDILAFAGNELDENLPANSFLRQLVQEGIALYESRGCVHPLMLRFKRHLDQAS